MEVFTMTKPNNAKKYRTASESNNDTVLRRMKSTADSNKSYVMKLRTMTELAKRLDNTEQLETAMQLYADVVNAGTGPTQGNQGYVKNCKTAQAN